MKMPLKSGLVFWTGGFIAWVSDKGIAEIEKLYSGLSLFRISLISFTILLAMAFGAAVVKNFDVVALRLLEGYHWPVWLKSWWMKRQDAWWIDNARHRFDMLAEKASREPKSLMPEERRELAELDRKLMYLPDEGKRLPTQLGNILRTAEMRPREKYGLDAFVCFPRLWLLMPKEATAELSHAREILDTATHVWMWSFLFIFWGFLALWTVPAGLILTCLAHRWLLDAAETYGQLVESSFDVYRPLLYQSLRWRLPANAEEEHREGERLTAYLWRGSDQPEHEFVDINKT